MPEDVQVAPQKHQYLIGRRKDVVDTGSEQFNLVQLKQVLEKEADAEIIKVISPRGLVSIFAGTEIHPESVLVVRITEERVRSLKEAAANQLIIEPDFHLNYSRTPRYPYDIVVRDPAVLVPNSIKFVTTITVKGENNQPIPGARVYLFGNQWPAQGLTDENGQVRLTVYGETGEALRGLHIEPRADYWSLWIPGPFLETERNNVVVLKPLNQSFDKLPDQQYTGWGQQAMNLDRLPAFYTGKGVKVALIDSGAAISHHDLEGQVKGGYDLVNQSDQMWNQDLELHGTHCMGIVAGKNNNYGIRGFAPEADVYIFKIFPGGRFSDLIDALERCIELQIDVVNLSVSVDMRSQLVEQELQKAKAHGVACIAAAGNSAGAVEYPAASPHVLAVAAIGRKDTFPSDSYHSTQVFTGENPFTSEGFFSAKFSCFGPEVGICAPGVAILSSVPPNNFAVWDGTSLAAPHITGLAALILAHHTDFQGQGQYAKHDNQRVDGLFRTIQQSARRLDLGDPGRIGAGLPDALVALNLAMGPSATNVWQQLLSDLQKLLSLAGVQTREGMPATLLQGVVPQPEPEIDVDQAMLQLDALILQAQLRPVPESREGKTFAELASGNEEIDRELQKLDSLILQAGLRNKPS